MSIVGCYVVDVRELKLVLLFVIEHEAVLIQEAHNGRLPSRAAKEVDNDIEKPVLPAVRKDLLLPFPTLATR